jgi:hypothetical protein
MSFEGLKHNQPSKYMEGSNKVKTLGQNIFDGPMREQSN